MGLRHRQRTPDLLIARYADELVGYDRIIFVNEFARDIMDWIWKELRFETRILSMHNHFGCPFVSIERQFRLSIHQPIQVQLLPRFLHSGWYSLVESLVEHQILHVDGCLQR